MSVAPAAAGSMPRTLSEDPILEHSAGLAVDDDNACIATGFGGAARIVAVQLR